MPVSIGSVVRMCSGGSWERRFGRGMVNNVSLTSDLLGEQIYSKTDITGYKKYYEGRYYDE